MHGSLPRSVIAQGVVSSVLLEMGGFPSLCAGQCHELFLYSGTQAFLFRVTESVVSSETKHFENCITRSRQKQGTTLHGQAQLTQQLIFRASCAEEI
jgi:hypothetical protein